MYWAMTNREALAASRDEERFYRELLVGFSPNDLIFDIGANGGAKTDIFLRLGGRVIAIEPDETNLTTLSERFLQYRIKKCPVTLVGKAVSDRVAVEKMWIDGPGSAVNTLNRTWADYLQQHIGEFKYGHNGLKFTNSKAVQTTTVEELIDTYGRPYFIKIDVEGYELKVLKGMRQAVPFLSFEVNLKVLRQEGIDCVRLLEELKCDGDFNYTADCTAGLSLKHWLQCSDFCTMLKKCDDETVEVFWRSNCGVMRSQALSQTNAQKVRI